MVRVNRLSGDLRKRLQMKLKQKLKVFAAPLKKKLK